MRSTGRRFSFPVVLKPNDGAGSDSVQIVHSAATVKLPANSTAHRVEQFIEGQPVSVSVIRGDSGVNLLPPTGQRFDAQPIGHYVGAKFPLPDDIAHRATRLAEQCANALPATRGYFGIDMVIADEGPKSDCVIEVNPRLTCSYVHLRKIVPENLAAMMLESIDV